MRKILTFLVTLFSLTSIAQTVYFGSISKKTSVGLGINGNNVMDKCTPVFYVEYSSLGI